jgi:hypothetical protein
MEWHLAQVNIGRLRARVDDPLIADFVANLDRINALADAAAGFVWRLQTEDGNATAIRPVDEDELLAINLSVWESVEALADYVYRSAHVGFMRRRREGSSDTTRPIGAVVDTGGTIPTVPEALARSLDRSRRPTPAAFTFKQRFAPRTTLPRRRRRTTPAAPDRLRATRRPRGGRRCANEVGILSHMAQCSPRPPDRALGSDPPSRDRRARAGPGERR